MMTTLKLFYCFIISWNIVELKGRTIDESIGFDYLRNQGDFNRTIEKRSDGGWSKWNAWGPCSVSCGVGNNVRSRTCNYTTHCEGSNNQSRICFTQICPIIKEKKLKLNSSLARLSTTYKNQIAALAISDSCNMSRTEVQDNPAWSIDIHKGRFISRIKVTIIYEEGKLYHLYALVAETRPDINEVDFDNYCDHSKSQHRNVSEYEFSCLGFGRYVTVAMKSESIYLQLCKVEIYAHFNVEKIQIDSNNAWMTSTNGNYAAGQALHSSCIGTNHPFLSGTKMEKNPAWAVDLVDYCLVTGVNVRARSDTEAAYFYDSFVIVTEEKPNLESIEYRDYCAAYDKAAKAELIYYLCDGMGRYVAIVLMVNMGKLELCHVSIYRANNVGKIALNPNLSWQSSTLNSGYSSKAISGSCEYKYEHETKQVQLFAITELQANPIWAIDLENDYIVYGVYIRIPEHVHTPRNILLYAAVTKTKPKLLVFKITEYEHCWHFFGLAYSMRVININCKKAWGRYVTLGLKSNWDYLALCHVAVYTVTKSSTTKRECYFPFVYNGIRHYDCVQQGKESFCLNNEIQTNCIQQPNFRPLLCLHCSDENGYRCNQVHEKFLADRGILYKDKTRAVPTFDCKACYITRDNNHKVISRGCFKSRSHCEDSRKHRCCYTDGCNV